jgi:hypothetical protein
LETIGEKIDLLKANFHPLTHFETAKASKNSIAQTAKKISKLIFRFLQRGLLKYVMR